VSICWEGGIRRRGKGSWGKRRGGGKRGGEGVREIGWREGRGEGGREREVEREVEREGGRERVGKIQRQERRF
jgi:hypothetical protein